MIPVHMEIALGYIGTHEVAGPGTNPKIGEWLKSVGMDPIDEIAWCAAAVNGILREAGLEGSDKPTARSYLEWGTRLHIPEFGCIVVLRRGLDWQGHVGFFMDLASDYIYVLGGNQGNRVGMSRYHDSLLLDYRKVIYL